jgi:hypothetical protein
VVVSTNTSILTYGNRSGGKGLPPAGVTNALGAAAGATFTISYAPDWIISAWGEGLPQGLDQPVFCLDVLSVAAGTRHALAVVRGPAISGVPRSLTAAEGSDVTLHGNVISPKSTKMQWFANGQARTGETNAMLILGKVGPADAATYVLTATDAAGVATQSSTRLLITATRPTILMEAPEVAGNEFRFGVSGAELFRIYRVQVSENLASWVDLTNVLSSSTSVSLTDGATGNSRARFYRVVSP